MVFLLFTALGTCGDDGSGGCSGNDSGCSDSSSGSGCGSNDPPPPDDSSGSSCVDDTVDEPDYYYYDDGTGCEGPHYVCVDCNDDSNPPPPSPPPLPPAPVQSLERVSRGVYGQNAAGPSFTAAVSQEGRLVAFASDADNLMLGDFNRASDVHLYDRTLKRMRRLSSTRAGRPGNGASLDPALSPEGNFAAFISYASDLVRSDPNENGADLFLLDTRDNELVLITPGANAGAESPSLSGNGWQLAFSSRSSNLTLLDLNGSVRDVFVYSRATKQTLLASQSLDLDGADGPSGEPALSADGRFVAFESLATDLVSDDSNGFVRDVFLFDLNARRNELVSLAAGGNAADGPSHAPSLSADGRFVAFHSEASNLVSGDLNGAVADIFVRDRRLGSTQILTRDADGPSGFASISAAGRFVAFESAASNLAASDFNGSLTDVFVADRESGRLRLASPSLYMDGADGATLLPAISGDGSTVAFESFASNLVAGDINNELDVFAGPNLLSP